MTYEEDIHKFIKVIIVENLCVSLSSTLNKNENENS